jgi:ABC-type uncharacterized transport system involved in gliding motility auxiliary subunit
MNNNKKQSAARARNYSLIALIFALLACIATFFLGVVRGLRSMELFTGLLAEDINRYLIVSVGLVILGLAAYAIMEPNKVRRFLTGRQARYGSNTIVMTIAFLGIFIVGNVLAYQLANQNPELTWDLTEDQANTLPPELTKALEALPGKVTATAFFSQLSDTTMAEELLSKIKANSKGKFDYSFIDPDRDPQAALDAGITGDGKILLQMGEQQEIVAFASEAEILKGLTRLINPGNNVIYFLTGHGELDAEQAGDVSMTRARETLESKNYAVKTVNLLTEKQVPEDASVIVIAGPIQPVSQEEIDLLRDYLVKGGSLIVMENPTALTEFGEEADPLADMLVQDWGITLNNDIVIDLDSPEPTTAAAAFYENHPITVSMNRIPAYFPFSRSLNVADSAGEATLTPLVQTNQRSWGETDFESLRTGGQVVMDSGEAQGPLTLAVAGLNSTTGGRVVAFGTSDFAADQMFDTYGNGDMFINSVDWAAEQEQSIGITPKTPTLRTFNAPDQFPWLAILLFTVFVIPGLVILSGISTWLTRRRQG